MNRAAMSTIGPDARWYKARPSYSPEVEAQMLVARNEPVAWNTSYGPKGHHERAALAEALAAFIVADLA